MSQANLPAVSLRDKAEWNLFINNLIPMFQKMRSTLIESVMMGEGRQVELDQVGLYILQETQPLLFSLPGKYNALEVAIKMADNPALTRVNVENLLWILDKDYQFELEYQRLHAHRFPTREECWAIWREMDKASPDVLLDEEVFVVQPVQIVVAEVEHVTVENVAE